MKRSTSGATSSSSTGAAPVAAVDPHASSVCIPPPNFVQERYPLCVVWTPIPLITWILPFVGHMGIADSRGIIHDFAGPYYIGEDCLAFGNPVKYWRLDYEIAASAGCVDQSLISTPVSCGPLDVERRPDGSTIISGTDAGAAIRNYDAAIYRQRDRFRETQNYNFFCNNCHSYCAYCMETAGAGGRPAGWNMVKLAILVFFKGKYVSVARFMQAHLPFFILVAIIVAVTTATSQTAKK